jgi:hypothetical protein
MRNFDSPNKKNYDISEVPLAVVASILRLCDFRNNQDIPFVATYSFNYWFESCHDNYDYSVCPIFFLLRQLIFSDNLSSFIFK